MEVNFTTNTNLLGDVKKKCFYFGKIKGCRDGDICTFSHVNTPSQKNKPSSRVPVAAAAETSKDPVAEKNKTPRCRHYLNGSCVNLGCVFFHDEILRSSNSLKVCRGFTSAGGCTYGAICRFSHASV
jgi:hypothetical protein